MSIKGFSINGQVQRYDYNALDNIPPSSGGGGITNEVKEALLQLAQKVAYVDANGQTYYQALYDALNAAAKVLTSITAVFNQGSTVIYTTDTLNDLKPMLTVTANYSDSTTETVTNYTLSGNLTEGTSVITVSYGGKTTTFNVTVTAVAGMYTIANNLTGCTTSNSATAIAENTAYNATITASAGYTLTGATVSVTMGGTDVTNTAYSSGTISIANVTGNIVITVSASPAALMYNWDLTESLVDKVSNQQITLLNSQNGQSLPTRDSSGLHFTAAEQVASLVELDSLANKRIEIDISAMSFAGNSTAHKRFLVNANTDGSGGNSLFVFRQSTGGWQMYNGSWRAYRDYAISGQTVPNTVDAISGKTIAIQLDNSSHPTLYVDDVAVATIPSYSAGTGNRLMIGGNATDAATAGNQIYNCTITGIRIRRVE